MATIPEMLGQAKQFQHAGDLARAEQLYQGVIQTDPSHADAWAFLAKTCHDNGKPAEAEKALRQAVQLRPSDANMHNNLGNVLACRGRIDDAVACFREALRLNPDFPEAHNNLGNALRIQGRLEEALGHIREAMALKAHDATAHHNLGIALLQQERVEEAIDCFQRALRLKPDYCEALAALQQILCAQPEHAGAMASLQQAVQRAPNMAGAHNSLGNALARVGRCDEAVACYEQAVRLNPTLAEAHNNLGIVLCKEGRLDEGLASFHRALQLKPDYADAHNNLGSALKDQGQIDEAINCYRRARQFKPQEPTFHSNLLGTLNYHPRCDGRLICEEQRRWELDQAQPVARATPSFANDPSPDRRLRIAYVSPDFRDHVVGHNVWPLLRNHNHEQLEVTLLANQTRADTMTEQFRRCADRWYNIAGWSDDRVADQIGKDGIDILVDLALHTAGNRLLVFARKPAPVQVTFAGYPGSTGLHAIDYRLTDPYLDPPQLNDQWYAEASCHLPHSFWCFDPRTEEPLVAPLPALQKGAVTFGCLNNFCKVNDGVLELWARVLRAVPETRLLLLAKEGSHRQRTCDFLTGQGVHAERLEFVSPKPRPEYLAVYHQIDIGLDTLPYNGHTTSLDSFWMGVPVVTLVGQTVVGRAGLSQLSNLGLAELAATTPEQFVRIAVELAADVPRLGALRSSLRNRMRESPLMDAVGFTRGIETGYRAMWRKWCADQRAGS